MSCGRIIVIVERHTSLSTTPNALDNSIRQKQWQDGEAASINLLLIMVQSRRKSVMHKFDTVAFS